MAENSNCASTRPTKLGGLWAKEAGGNKILARQRMCPWIGCFATHKIAPYSSGERWLSFWARQRSLQQFGPCPEHEGRRPRFRASDGSLRGSRKWWAYRAAGKAAPEEVRP